MEKSFLIYVVLPKISCFVRFNYDDRTETDERNERAEGSEDGFYGHVFDRRQFLRRGFRWGIFGIPGLVVDRGRSDG